MIHSVPTAYLVVVCRATASYPVYTTNCAAQANAHSYRRLSDYAKRSAKISQFVPIGYLSASLLQSRHSKHVVDSCRFYIERFNRVHQPTSAHLVLDVPGARRQNLLFQPLPHQKLDSFELLSSGSHGRISGSHCRKVGRPRRLEENGRRAPIVTPTGFALAKLIVLDHSIHPIQQQIHDGL